MRLWSDLEVSLLRECSTCADIYTEEGGIRSRKGTVRNTDSFFKDDSVETRKINLTPSLLRDDDSSGSTVKSVEAKEVCFSCSLVIIDLLNSAAHDKRKS